MAYVNGNFGVINSILIINMFLIIIDNKFLLRIKKLER